MLVIVNPYATTVSARLKHLVVYALRGRYEVDSVETQSRNHATELCREAAQEGYDVVCAFGGDGTFNEAANGLAGSETPLTCLPGGSTNVFCRILGIPNDVVDATEHLLGDGRRLAPARDRPRRRQRPPLPLHRRRRPRRERDEARRRPPAAEGALRPVVLRDGGRRRVQPRVRREPAPARGRAARTARRSRASRRSSRTRRPTPTSRAARSSSPRTSRSTTARSRGVVLHRASPLDMPTVTWRALSPRARILRHRRVDGFAGAGGGHDPLARRASASRCRSTATTSASCPRSSRASSRARCASSPDGSVSIAGSIRPSKRRTSARAPGDAGWRSGRARAPRSRGAGARRWPAAPSSPPTTPGTGAWTPCPSRATAPR